jgi:hypothetical protein
MTGSVLWVAFFVLALIIVLLEEKFKTTNEGLRGCWSPLSCRNCWLAFWGMVQFLRGHTHLFVQKFSHSTCRRAAGKRSKTGECIVAALDQRTTAATLRHSPNLGPAGGSQSMERAAREDASQNSMQSRISRILSSLRFGTCKATLHNLTVNLEEQHATYYVRLNFVTRP